LASHKRSRNFSIVILLGFFISVSPFFVLPTYYLGSLFLSSSMCARSFSIGAGMGDSPAARRCDCRRHADGDPDGYALAVNINRRHLKASARHLIAEMARRLGGPKLGQSSRQTAKALDVSHNRLNEAGVVLDYAPDLVEKIFAGGMTLQQAAEIARPRKHDATETKKKMERLRVEASALAAASSLSRSALSFAMLEARVTALEAKLAKQPGDACPNCGERAMRRTSAGMIMRGSRNQWREDVWTCEKCAQQETRIIQF
jgi:ribosomal protein L37AE/L43A